MSIDFLSSTGGGTGRSQAVAERPALGQREKEILIAWLRRESKVAAARDMYVTSATVRTHVQRVRAKYQAVGRPAPTKVDLLIRFLEDGTVTLDDLR